MIKRIKKRRRQHINVRFDEGASHQSFTRQHLQQFNEHASVPQVQVEVGDATADPGQDRVDPFCEGLLLNRLTLIWWEHKVKKEHELHE